MSIIHAFVNLLRDEHYRAHFILTLALLFVGAVFYHFYEGWGWIDAAYFSVITLTTVGYGDLYPVTDIGKIFTMFYIMIGIGILLSFINLFAEKMIAARKESVERARKQKKEAKKEVKNTYKKHKEND